MKTTLLKQLRSAKFTLKEFAARIGISESQISNIENGKREPRVHELEKMAAELGVSPSIFLDDPNGSGLAFTSGYVSETIRPFGDVSGVPVMGECYSRRWIEEEAASRDGRFEEVPVAPGRFDPRSQFAFKIGDESMTARGINSGEYVICVPYFDARETEISGDIVVIERRRSELVEISCREIVKVNGRIEFYSRPEGHKEAPVVTNQEFVEENGEPVKLLGLVIGKYQPLFG